MEKVLFSPCMGLFLLPTRRGQAIPQHSYGGEVGIIPPSPDLPASQYTAMLLLLSSLNPLKSGDEGHNATVLFWVCVTTKEKDSLHKSLDLLIFFFPS